MSNQREINESSFGGQLYKMRKAALLSFDGFRTALGVTKTYLNDVETDFVRPPTPKMQIAMAGVLSKKKKPASSELLNLFDTAASARGELPADIYMFLKGNPKVICSLRESTEYAEFLEKTF